MLSVGAIHFEDRFCAIKRGEIGKGAWAQVYIHAMHMPMAAALAGCRMALVGTGWTLLAQTDDVDTTPLPL